MYAVIIFAVFSTLMGVLGSIVLNSVSDSANLSQALRKETEEYYQNIQDVVNKDLTPSLMQVAPADQTAAQILQSRQVSLHAPGKWANPLVDAWGNALRIPNFFPRENIALGSEAVVPITGFVLISAGPDRAFQTTLPANNQVQSIYGVAAPSGSDDVVMIFTNEVAQREVLQRLKLSLERIASAMLNHYRIQMAEYRGNLQSRYFQALRNNPTLPPPDINTLIASDINAPRFVDIRNHAARAELGVQEEFTKLERLLPNNGRLEVTFAEADPDLRRAVTLVLRNSAASPSPWPVVNIRFPLRGGV